MDDLLRSPEILGKIEVFSWTFFLAVQILGDIAITRAIAIGGLSQKTIIATSKNVQNLDYPKLCNALNGKTGQ